MREGDVVAEPVLAQEVTAPLPAPVPARAAVQPDSPALECASGVVVHANPAAARLAGRQTPSELIGWTLDDLLTGPDADADLHRPDGTTVAVRVLRWSPPGSAVPVLLLADVSDLRTARGALQTERSRLTEAQRISRTGSFTKDLATGRMSFSDALLEIFAQRSVDPDQDPRMAVHPDDRAALFALEQRAIADPVGDTYEAEFRGWPDGGSTCYVCRVRAERSPGGEAVRIVGTVQDVTAQRLAESRVERSRQRFADLVAIAPVGIGIFDDTDRLVDANDALCGLLGYELEALRGATIADLAHPDGSGEWPQALRGPAAHSYTLPQRRLVRADGESVYCELHVASSLRDNGQRFGLVVFADVSERRRVAEALRYQTTHDELTGLGNRTAVTELLGELLATRTDVSGVAVLFCDIDNFTRVNDSLGHDAGDELLVALARRLADGLPDDCVAARLSGDVYVVICPDAPAHGGVQALVNRVGGLLRTAVPLRGQLLRVSAAIGVAVPDGAAGPEDLLRFADTAMSQAKRQGTGRVALASASLMATADRQVALEGQLRDALAHDGLELYFQPVVSPSGSVLAAEALVRWEHPDQGMLPPDQFLPVAEQGDLMRELDRWVLRSALAQAWRWPERDGRAPAVAVNLAGLVPGDPGFVDTIATAVAESGIAWDRVVLELVETALVDLPARTRRSMDELVNRGIRFAVDDFGTGYSSLARLKELPAQIVKVDRRFVSGVGTDPSDVAVARAVVDMARAMGRSCVAEGVETATQYHVLRGLGVQAYQGWLFSRPVAGAEFRGMLTP